MSRRWKNWVKSLCSLLIVFGHEAYAVKPVFVIPTDVWDEKTPIFIANTKLDGVKTHKEWRAIQLETGRAQTTILDMVFVGAPKTKYPTTAFQGFEKFRENQQKRQKVIYALATQGVEHKAYLYQLDAETGKELLAYPLLQSIEDGQMMVEDVYFNQAWHSILVLTFKAAKNSSFQYKIIDVTDPKKYSIDAFFLQPHTTMTSPPNGAGFIALSAPKIIRTSKGDWGFGVAGKMNQDGIIQWYSFQDSKSLCQMKASKNEGFLEFLPVDLTAKGCLDSIYGIDARGDIWWMDFSHTQAPLPQKITATPVSIGNQKMRIVRSATGEGIEFLTLTPTGVTRTLAVGTGVKDNIQQQILSTGQYLDFFLTGGYLLLIPKSSKQKPELFVRAAQGYTKINCDWQFLWGEHQNQTHYVQTAFIWDPEGNQIKLLCLDENGQLSFLQSKRQIDGVMKSRVAWRRNLGNSR